MKKMSVILPILFLSFLVFIFSAKFALAAISPQPLQTVDPSTTTDPVSTGTQCNLLNGDVNCDGVTDMVDYLYYVRYAAGVRTFPAGITLDLDNSGTIDSVDRCYIIKGITGNGNACSTGV